jgi:hypothetical protein
MNVTTNGTTVHNGWIGFGESGVHCGSAKRSNYKITQFKATNAPVNCKRCLGIREERPAAPVVEKTITTIAATDLTEGMMVMVKGNARKVVTISSNINGEALNVRVRIGAKTKTFPVRKTAKVKVQS